MHNTDKLFNVTLVSTDSNFIYGVIKAENMPEVLRQISREYPNYSVRAIEESNRKLL